MSEPISAYPLAWPPGWRRTSHERRRRDNFSQRGEWLTVAAGVNRVLAELQRLGVDHDDVVISTNVRPTLSGVPRSGERAPQDPGAAIYWIKRGQKQRCMAIDRYLSVAGNLGAIAATLEAMRAIERHGGAEILDRAFTGFAALPAPEQPWQVLELETSQPTRDQVEEAHLRLAMKHHPDRGGDGHTMARINAARDELLGGMR
jgi:hypothetical protein